MRYNQLSEYIPENSLDYIERWFSPFNIQLKISKDRKTKLGDYRKVNQLHQISVNGNLKPEAFFFVLTHEFAHLLTYHLYGNKKILAHGKEWKKVFGDLLIESSIIYSESIRKDILNHAKKPKASVTADPRIAKNLLHEEVLNQVYLEDLEEGTLFTIGNKLFEKGKKRKIRYLCREKYTGKDYLVNGLALVNIIRNDEQ